MGKTVCLDNKVIKTTTIVNYVSKRAIWSIVRCKQEKIAVQ